METELRRLALRNNVDQIDVTAVIARVWFIDLDPVCYRQAGLLPGLNLRGLDAIHIAAALHRAGRHRAELTDQAGTNPIR